jgi:hypothetical protein
MERHRRVAVRVHPMPLAMSKAHRASKGRMCKIGSVASCAHPARTLSMCRIHGVLSWARGPSARNWMLHGQGSCAL